MPQILGLGLGRAGRHLFPPFFVVGMPGFAESCCGTIFNADPAIPAYFLIQSDVVIDDNFRMEGSVACAEYMLSGNLAARADAS